MERLNRLIASKRLLQQNLHKATEPRGLRMSAIKVPAQPRLIRPTACDCLARSKTIEAKISTVFSACARAELGSCVMRTVALITGTPHRCRSKPEPVLRQLLGFRGRARGLPLDAIPMRPDRPSQHAPAAWPDRVPHCVQCL